MNSNVKTENRSAVAFSIAMLLARSARFQCLCRRSGSLGNREVCGSECEHASGRGGAVPAHSLGRQARLLRERYVAADCCRCMCQESGGRRYRKSEPVAAHSVFSDEDRQPHAAARRESMTCTWGPGERTRSDPSFDEDADLGDVWESGTWSWGLLQP